MAYKITNNCMGCGTCAKKCPEQAITGEIKNRFDIDPLRCIECGLCFNICPKGAILDPEGNPSSVKSKKKKKRIRAMIDSDACACCKNCYINCPQDAIQVIKKHFFHVGFCEVDQNKCVGCGTCTDYCITGAVVVE
ncbi:MAG: 4Fe-4S binding protein [Candidatus Magnetomorum sp.]|nr:4Fe-4S binding protein [Candidatus Magnetomorum sp.]